MINTIGDWIDQRISGGHIYGPSRFGKSRAVKWHLKAVLENRFKATLPLVVWIRRGDSAVSEVEFWNALLRASGYEFYNPEKPKAKAVAKFLFEQQVVTLARLSRGNYVVLLIDEAHDMTLKEWKWLLGLQNELDNQGIRFSVISIGSYELQYQPDYLARTGNAHIAARFYACDTKFHGIGSVDELGYVLNGYDINSEWPKMSGVSYTQYFAQDPFAQGLRLLDCKDNIWAAFGQLLPPGLQSKKGFKLELPMLHIACSVEQALRRLGSGEDWEKVTAFESWLQMVAKTGFTDHLRKIS
ncbi:MAG: ATP-binding protein [Methylococcales bacterium]|nr:ATP-binding protein [Methylococcales bacterium]